MNNPGSNRFNLGSGKGYSVLEVIEACKKVSNFNIPIVYGP
jgi:UDP-glucose 4-epimerase